MNTPELASEAFQLTVRQAFERCRELLLSEITAAGHWEGELSTSALSTATAVMALHQVREKRDDLRNSQEWTLLIEGGLQWLIDHRNPDAGWGDTTLSISNISTTMLVRAVFAATAGQYGQVSQFPPLMLQQIDDYISQCGGLQAVKDRYGQDRTFSVPILMQCALGGLADWSQVDQLPFELACLPANWYKWAQLPVVSYALPALITIGLVRHRKRPTKFLHWRWLRQISTSTALRVLTRIQPTTGGFLEATPLTSFVTMSLAAAGEVHHPVVEEALRFLKNSVRPDGSWPIDTNLATWVTTLSLNGLGETLPDKQVEPVVQWLLDQQYQVVHPYTNADPGGWAWTDLPGGVPDADDTPGAILAILSLRERCSSALHEPINQAATRAIRWLLSLQNRDGGWPTFCKGWGKLPFDRSSPDITAHVLRAIQLYSTSVESTSVDLRHCQHAQARGQRFLRSRQRPDGAWLPLWFGNQAARDDENPTYGTARVMLAFPAEAQQNSRTSPLQRGARFLESIQNDDGGWGGAAGTPSSVEETAIALEALLHAQGNRLCIQRGCEWLCRAVAEQRITQPAPIGFYFAKLWYFEKLYPLVFATSALRKAADWWLTTETLSSPQ